MYKPISSARKFRIIFKKLPQDDAFTKQFIKNVKKARRRK